MKKKRIKNVRLQYIDIAKGIAMICIILGHLGNANINRIVFTFHVPIFFFITGYFTNSKRDLNDFIKKSKNIDCSIYDNQYSYNHYWNIKGSMVE